MEEKERYIIDKSTSYYTNTIVDTETNAYYGNIKEHIALLNQQAKQIKDLKEKHNYLFKEFRDACKRFVLMAFNYEYSKEEIKRLTEENQQLEQQLHDLPKKIVEEIRKEIEFPLYAHPNFDEFECVFDIDKLLDTILKKYEVNKNE